MKYYLIVGEASGDLHASHLMAELKKLDKSAQFRFFGGDKMQQVGGELIRHYKNLAFMGFIPVLLHLRTIFANMKFCKQDIIKWNPDVVIMVDYPGFNLKIAEYLKRKSSIPVYYYISPKIWAWKEYRIKNIRRDVDQLFSILPFEVDFYKKHNYPIHYVGNPTVDEVSTFKSQYNESFDEFIKRNNLKNKPIIALLAGSRKQEIKDNLPLMLKAVSEYKDFQIVLAGAPGIDRDHYDQFIKDYEVNVIFNETYPLMHHAHTALVTSGTATLETALFKVPQVVCYYTPCGKIVSFLRKILLKVNYISLVNLIVDDLIIQELVADSMTLSHLKSELNNLIKNKKYRQDMLTNYDKMEHILGTPGAANHAATKIIQLLKSN